MADKFTTKMAIKKKINLIPKEAMQMYKQTERLKTFADWPFKDNCLCTAVKMAEAGFYHTPSENEPDLVTCFVCYKELDGWEPTDDPWQEHKNHSSKCPFVTNGKKPADWKVEDIINMEIKRQQFAVTKSVEEMVNRFLDEAKDVKEQLEAIYQC
eukprot:gene9276-10254_t